jgi:hypothetical protein
MHIWKYEVRTDLVYRILQPTSRRDPLRRPSNAGESIYRAPQWRQCRVEKRLHHYHRAYRSSSSSELMTVIAAGVRGEGLPGNMMSVGLRKGVGGGREDWRRRRSAVGTPAAWGDGLTTGGPGTETEHGSHAAGGGRVRTGWWIRRPR